MLFYSDFFHCDHLGFGESAKRVCLNNDFHFQTSHDVTNIYEISQNEIIFMKNTNFFLIYQRDL